MFLKRNYRRRALGVVAAYAVLGIGIAVSGAFEPAAEAESQVGAKAVIERAEVKALEQCSSLEKRSEIVC